MLIWLAAWGTLHQMWGKQEVHLPHILAAIFLLIGLGLLFMFPPLFELFAE